MSSVEAEIVQDAGKPAELKIRPLSQWALIRRRFLKHRLAVVSGVVVILFYLVAAFADFIAYSDPGASNAQRVLVPPQSIHVWMDGKFAPYVDGLIRTRNSETLALEYASDPAVKLPVVLFAHGYPYQFFGFIPADIHWIGIRGAPTESSLFLFGADELGRDLFSRIAVGIRTSLTIGLIAVSISFVLGMIFGALSGFYGGLVDLAIQRLIEMLRAIPTLPLWMGLAAAIPPNWGVKAVYFTITIIIALIGWTDLARELRGKIMALRHEDFVLAAELYGAPPRRIMAVHLLPLCISHIIATLTLALPAMILSETSLSFLGLGLRPPAISLGVLLSAAQNIQAAALYPWLIWPAFPTALVILCFNFLGDGLRDAADPYG